MLIRCGIWSERVVKEIMAEVREKEEPRSEGFMLNYVELLYREERIDEMSRRIMMNIACEYRAKGREESRSNQNPNDPQARENAGNNV